MGFNKLNKMVNAKNAMDLNWGEMIYQYVEVVTSKENAKDLRRKDVATTILSDGILTFSEVVDGHNPPYLNLGLAKQFWEEMGGNSDSNITKAIFIQSMRRFCSEWKECYKDVSECPSYEGVKITSE